MTQSVTLDSIRGAAERIGSLVQRTPLIRSEFFSHRFGAEIWLKLETLQRTGSFKPRGAANKIALLAEGGGLSGRGVVAASAGNHAQGVALAATWLGVESTIVMPVNSSLSKQLATRGYGAKLELYGETLEESLQRARELKAEGSSFIHPFDDPDIVAGQGTVGLEIAEELPEADEIWTPVGGGGLAAGVAVAAKALIPEVRLVGVESDSCPAMSAALKAGKPVTVEAGRSVADGIRVAKVGEVPFTYLKDRLDTMEVVEEETIPDAILTFAEHKKIVVEGAGAITLSAQERAWQLDPAAVAGRRIVLVVSGGNIDSPLLGRALEKALVRACRVFHITVQLEDAPGALAKVFTLIAKEGGNVLDVAHTRDESELPMGTVRVRVKLEARDKEHSKQLARRLGREGYHL